MSQNAQPHLSLLSLSIAASNAAPIPAESVVRSSQGPTTNTIKHRRLSSAGRSRRRVSDARDAATRPFPTSLQTASASLAALSLSSPTAASHRSIPGPQPIQVPRATFTKRTSEPEPASVDDIHLSLSPPQSHTPLASNSVNVVRSGRKRGTIFTCESCSKVGPTSLYRSCDAKVGGGVVVLSSSLALVDGDAELDLAQAAAILSHLSPSSASLPEDRSLWPSFLSGGLVPPPASMSNGDVGSTPLPTTTTTATSPPTSTSTSPSSVQTSFPISSSVPASMVSDSYRAGSAGPRLHDYTINGGGIGVTQVRPGVLGVPTSAMSGKSSPMAVAAATMTTEDDALNLLALREADMTDTASLSHPHAHSHSHSLSYSHPHSLSLSHTSKERERRRSNAYEYGFVSESRSGSGPGTGFGFGYDYRTFSSGYAYAPDSNGGWSLPRSSVRSKSGSSGSGSRSQSAASESRSDDEEEGVFGDLVDVGVDLEDEVDGARMSMGWRSVYGSRVREDEQEDAEGDKGMGVGGVAEQTWDGMEMEMEMD
ncbi:hypothetical protein J3R82DRAFT_1958 [Butyriboletus roseoflavus]|nr:hypothetical protein J3R82DRAFT_1958 [Butyriboletus roseoflavus]